VRSLADDGTAIVLSTQYLEEADRLADEILVIDRGQAVAQGSPAALKAQLERDVLEVHLRNDSDVEIARDMVAFLSDVIVDTAARRIDIRVSGTAERPLDLLRRLEDGDVGISHFQLRQPTLDDVFLSLTGSPPSEDEETTE
jgi:ABC-2 type transport system ATP-binding protein